jgi:hypothetical protein
MGAPDEPSDASEQPPQGDLSPAEVLRIKKVSAEAEPGSEALSAAGELTRIREEKEVIAKFNVSKRVMISLIYRHLFNITGGDRITAADILRVWPQGKNAEIHPELKGEPRISAYRAGIKPTINDLQLYLKTEEFLLRMRELGIEIDPEDTGLTAEQLGLLTILSDMSDGKDLRRKLRAANVNWPKFQVWLKERNFKEAYSKLTDDTLKAAIPVAKNAIAVKMAQGDMAAIKYGFELTGVYNPNDQRAVDSQELVRIVLEVIEEVVRDQNVLLEIASKISMRSAALTNKQAPMMKEIAD